MKIRKLIASVLCLLLVVSAFAGCTPEEETPAGDLPNAQAYLTNMYQTAGKNETMEMLMDKDMLSVVAIDGVSYSVEWSVTVTQGDADSVKVVESTKENHVKIDVPDLPDYDVLFTATAVIKDAAGNTASVSFNYKVSGLNAGPAPDANGTTTTTQDGQSGGTTTTTQNGNQGGSDSTPPATDMTAIVDAAYALAENTALSGEYTLTGKVISVNDAYDAEFNNITVTIQVAGREDKPIQCYRMKGTGIDQIAKGDTITVTGTLKNYNGTVEFDTGCTLRKRESGGEAPIQQESEASKIVAAAFALQPGEDMGYDVTLTGKVTKLYTAYDPAYENVSVIFAVEGKEILCYRMKGTDADKILVGDTITVTGRIKNYNGTIEFDAGCTLRKRESGGAVALTDPIEIVNAAYALVPGATLPSSVTLTGAIISIDTAYDPTYNNVTVTIEIDGCEDKPIKCYRMKGSGADALKVGDVITVTGVIKNYQHSSGDCEVEFDSGCTFVK